MIIDSYERRLSDGMLIFTSGGFFPNHEADPRQTRKKKPCPRFPEWDRKFPPGGIYFGLERDPPAK